MCSFIYPWIVNIPSKNSNLERPPEAPPPELPDELISEIISHVSIHDRPLLTQVSKGFTEEFNRKVGDFDDYKIAKKATRLAKRIIQPEKIVSTFKAFARSLWGFRCIAALPFVQLALLVLLIGLLFTPAAPFVVVFAVLATIIWGIALAEHPDWKTRFEALGQ